MKVSLKSVLAVLALGLAVIPSLSMAADAAPGGGQGQGGGRGGPSPEQRLAAIDTAVTLTADQKTKITAILTKSAADMQAVPQEERREKGQAIRAAANKEIHALLTAEQQVKFDAMPQGGRGQGGGQGGQGGQRGGAPAEAPKK